MYTQNVSSLSYVVCSWCWKRLEDRVVCDRCGCAYYCSVECRDSASGSHIDRCRVWTAEQLQLTDVELMAVLNSSVVRKLVASLKVSNILTSIAGLSESMVAVKVLPTLTTNSSNASIRYRLSFLPRKRRKSSVICFVEPSNGPSSLLVFESFRYSGDLPRADTRWLSCIIGECQTTGSVIVNAIS